MWERTTIRGKNVLAERDFALALQRQIHEDDAPDFADDAPDSH